MAGTKRKALTTDDLLKREESLNFKKPRTTQFKVSSRDVDDVTSSEDEDSGPDGEDDEDESVQFSGEFVYERRKGEQEEYAEKRERDIDYERYD